MDSGATEHEVCDKKLEKKLQDPTAEPMSLPLGFLKVITNDFSTKRELGRGAYGVVYKGVLQSGKVIAVKKIFDAHLLDNNNKFEDEITCLMGVRHQNVVRLIAYCVATRSEAMKLPSGKHVMVQTPACLLCFEFHCKGSLDKYVSDDFSVLDWDMRYEIIRGVCRGLHYLHAECHIVHLDLKPQNILMDATMLPKIADFGLSRLLGEQKSRTFTSNIAGTLGYMAQEYIDQGIISSKADIFSLGVIIIEIITGHRDYPNISERTETSLKHYTDKVVGSWRDRLTEITPMHMSPEMCIQQVQQCISIALKCLEPESNKRPTSLDIVQTLNAVEPKCMSPGNPSSVIEKIRLEKDREEMERRKKEKAEAHLYTIIKVARDNDLKAQIGKDIYFDLVDHDKVPSFRIQTQMAFAQFKEEVAKEFGIPTQFQRFWLWAKRQNHTFRPHRPLCPQDEAHTVGQLKKLMNKAHNAELKLFLEVELGLDLKPLPLPDKTREDIFLFFKLYEPEKKQLRYVGRLFVKASGRPQDILPKLRMLAGFSQEDDIHLYEEIKFEPYVMCEYIDNSLLFRSCQLEDGDIICFQKYSKSNTADRYKFPHVQSFLTYIRQVVHFRSLEKPKEDDFCLEMSKTFTYDQVVEKVAERLGVDDPSKIRLTSHNRYLEQPMPKPIQYRGVECLLDMLVHYIQVSVHSIRLPKNSTVGDVLNDIKTKVELSHPNAELSLLKVFDHKIYKVFAPNEKIENINDQYWTLRAEEVPEEEKNLGPFDRLIHVYHFTNQTELIVPWWDRARCWCAASPPVMQVQNFGEPFFMVIREDETLSSIKERIQKKLKVPDEDFSKWKFAYISLGRPDYFEDSDTVAVKFQRNMYGAWEQYLGLEHPDTAPRKAHTVNQNRHSFERPVKIYN